MIKSSNANSNGKELKTQLELFSLGIQILKEEDIYLNALSRLFPLGYGWLNSEEPSKELPCVSLSPFPNIMLALRFKDLLVSVRGAYHCL